MSYFKACLQFHWNWCILAVDCWYNCRRIHQYRTVKVLFFRQQEQIKKFNKKLLYIKTHHIFTFMCVSLKIKGFRISREHKHMYDITSLMWIWNITTWKINRITLSLKIISFLNWHLSTTFNKKSWPFFYKTSNCKICIQINYKKNEDNKHSRIRNQIQLSKLERYFTSFVITNINLGFIFYFLLGISLIFLFKQGFFWHTLMGLFLYLIIKFKELISTYCWFIEYKL